METRKIKTIFIGTPDFGIPTLLSLQNDELFDIVAVFTQPDKKIGRQQLLTETPIKKVALSYGLPVYQPEKIKNFAEDIKKLAPELIVVIAYAQIIPATILAIPQYGCINVHGSLLPKYRGAGCVQAAILNGDQQSGITIMKMDAGLDTGPIISQEVIDLEKTETSDSLFRKLSGLSGKIVVPTLKQYLDQKLTPVAQDDSLASLTKTFSKNDGKINWQDDAAYLERFIRAMYSWPGAFVYFKKERLQIIKTDNVILKINQHKVGEVFLYNNQIAIQSDRDALILQKIKLAGKNETSAIDFANGHKDFIGSLLN
jgi:methionyl-tRNA formyltransferase